MNISTGTEAMELDECILVWHIGTNVYLRWYKDQKLEQAKKEQAVDQEQPEDQEQAKREQAKEQQAMEHVETIEALSNYMLFILVARSSMLPEITSRSHYVELCYDLSENKFDSVPDLRTARNKEDFVRKLQDYGRSSNPLTEIYTLWRGSRLGTWLIGDA
jgi:predicted type IV restriction endonuclease